MSQESLAIYDTHRQYQVEEGKFSQTALIDGVTELKGIFDDHYYYGQKDAGNVPQQSHQKRFLVNTIPVFTPKVTTITIDSNKYIIIRSDKDKYGVPRLWLK